MLKTIRRLASAVYFAVIAAIAISTAAAEPSACPQRDGRPVPVEEFHIYLLMGQSNMAGRGKMTAEDRQPVPGIFSLDAKSAWQPAAHPLHFDKPNVAGVGLGLDSAKVLQQHDKQIVVGLVPCAFGGTRLDQWRPGDKLYENAVARAKTAARCGVLKGVLWHQGESDSTDQLAPTYAARLAEMLTKLRGDLGDHDLPIVVGELGQFRKQLTTTQVNAQLREVANSLPQVACASSEGLTHNGDSTHFDATALKEFGRRYAEKMIELQSRGD